MAEYKSMRQRKEHEMNFKKAGYVIIIIVLIAADIILYLNIKKSKRTQDDKSDNLKKMTEFYVLLVKWLTSKQAGRSIPAYFERNKYHKVAIYGMKELGILLYDELRNSNVQVEYIIDRNADTMNLDISVNMFEPTDELPAADVIVVTAVHFFDDIKASLKDRVRCPVVSLDEVIRKL